jgi:hypothetical protein
MYVSIIQQFFYKKMCFFQKEFSQKQIIHLHVNFEVQRSSTIERTHYNPPAPQKRRKLFVAIAQQKYINLYSVLSNICVDNRV